MSPEQFAEISNRAVMFASIVYVLALVAHVVEWASSVGRPRAGEPARGLAPVPATRLHEHAEQAGTVPGPTAAGGRPAAPGDGGGHAEDDAAEEARELRVEMFGRIGVSLTVVAALLHLTGAVARGLEAGRVPWGNMYEFTLTGSLAVVVLYLALLRRYQLRWMGLLVTLTQVVVLMLADLFLYEVSAPLVPGLDSYWLLIHVSAAILATGAFTVGGLASLAFLVKDRAARRSASGSRLLAHLPGTDVLDRVAYRFHAVGFPIWTFAALITGPIWAEKAWGSYWNWDPKEVWAFITWVVYAAYLHARATAGWRGRAAALVALVGLATLYFNFVGINFFFGGGSMHSYA